MKYKTTRKIANLGSSWCVTLEKKLLAQKGFKVGEFVKVTIETLETDDELLKRFGKKIMKEQDVNSVVVTKDGIFGELKKEDSDDDIDNEPPKD